MSVSLAKAPAVSLRKTAAPLSPVRFGGMRAEGVAHNDLMALAAVFKLGADDIGTTHRRNFSICTTKWHDVGWLVNDVA